jgi:hypothetical protein
LGVVGGIMVGTLVAGGRERERERERELVESLNTGK